MSKVSTTRVDKLLSSMGYGTRKDIAQLARYGGIVFDQEEIWTPPFASLSVRICQAV